MLETNYLQMKITALYDESKGYCGICDKTLQSSTLRRHLRHVHDMAVTVVPKVVPRKLAKPSVVPDVDDPNYFCKTCERTYTNRFNHRDHLQFFHQMKLTPLKRRIKIVHPDIQPDEDDPNFYCKACEAKFSTRLRYRYHLTRLHKMTF